MTLSEAVGVSVSVEAKAIRMIAEASLRREGDAAIYAQQAKEAVSDVTKILSGPILNRLDAFARGTSVSISASADIEAAWAALSTISTNNVRHVEAGLGQ